MVRYEKMTSEKSVLFALFSNKKLVAPPPLQDCWP